MGRKSAIDFRDDALFGKFTLNRGLNRYAAETTWMGAVTELSLQSDEKDAEFPQD